MNNRIMTPEEFEPIVRAKIKKRVDQGWIIMRGRTRERLEVDGAVHERACGLGCFVEDSGAFLKDAADAAGISFIAADNFASGFDGNRPTRYDDTAWYDLGRRVWTYAQELMSGSPASATEETDVNAQLHARVKELEDYLDQISNLLDEEEREPEETVEAIRNELNGLESERDAALARVKELEGELAIEQDGHTETARSLSAIESRIRELTEWRPMETAPKDGTRIELAFRVGLDEFERWETEVGYFGRTANEYASSGWQDSRAKPFFASPHFWRPVRELPEVPHG